MGGSQEKNIWVKWEHLALPKALGGWGLKNIFFFSKAFATKAGWRLISLSSLRTEVVWNKYIAFVPLLDWIHNPVRRVRDSSSCIWKTVLASLAVISSGLAWKVGNGKCFSTGIDP